MITQKKNRKLAATLLSQIREKGEWPWKIIPAVLQQSHLKPLEFVTLVESSCGWGYSGPEDWNRMEIKQAVRELYIQSVLDRKLSKSEVSAELTNHPQLIDRKALEWFLVMEEGLTFMDAETLAEFFYLLDVFSLLDRKDSDLRELAAERWENYDSYLKPNLRGQLGYKLLRELAGKPEIYPMDII